jgi:hypothetical protein
MMVRKLLARLLMGGLFAMGCNGPSTPTKPLPKPSGNDSTVPSSGKEVLPHPGKEAPPPTSDSAPPAGKEKDKGKEGKQP